jgi:hypothetical protein
MSDAKMIKSLVEAKARTFVNFPSPHSLLETKLAQALHNEQAILRICLSKTSPGSCRVTKRDVHHVKSGAVKSSALELC